ncbi:uncharacterized protein LOC142617344 [Castanea sativa]|uniref:uncharacterized protein LOC142617344 n=1 Tax=Castanea sativa TaxID=21020 RepID=UPI003F6549C6
MNEGMTTAAESGDIIALHQLIGEDENLLDRIDQVPRVQTPLHIAVSAGHIQFARVMMGLRPSFARKLNPNGFSPIHLALEFGHIELVHQFLEIDRDLVRVKGNECITPLHYLVANGDHHIDLLEKFLLVCFDSIKDVTVRDETALHIALRNDQLKAFKFLVGWLGRNFFKNASLDVKMVLDQMDDNGNNVLRIAVSRNETQIVSHLLAWGSEFVDVNSTNLEGKTAWDILQEQTQVNSREIGLMLHSAGAKSGVYPPNAQSDDNNIDEFYNLIGEDVQLLEHIDKLPFVNTPLHIAASYGNIQFALEMMTLKPSFARKQNQNGFSPTHLALRNKYPKLVVRLLQIDGDLLRVKGRERLTPLHYVVESGESLDLLEEFLSVCPDSIIDVTVRNETVLHIALKNDELETFKFFVEWLANNSSENAEFNQRKVLNWEDNKGNTVLHILASKNKIEAVTHLLCKCVEFMDVNHMNLDGKTAWDIWREDNREIRYTPCGAGAIQGAFLRTFINSNQTDHRLVRFAFMNRDISLEIEREVRKLTVEWRSMILVVAALIVTLCFQSVLTPPGGIWQDNGLCITTEPGSSYHQIPPFNKTIGSSNHPKIIYLSQSNTTLACEHKAGTAIALDDRLFALFVVCNTMVFSILNGLIVFLIPNLMVRRLFSVFSITLCFSYFYSAWTITDAPKLMVPLVSVASIYFFILQWIAWKK